MRKIFMTAALLLVFALAVSGWAFAEAPLQGFTAPEVVAFASPGIPWTLAELLSDPFVETGQSVVMCQECDMNVWGMLMEKGATELPLTLLYDPRLQVSHGWPGGFAVRLKYPLAI